MARVKGAMMTRKRRNKTLKLAKGYWGNKSTPLQDGQPGRDEVPDLRLYRPQAQEERFPQPVDHPHLRRLQDERHELLHLHARPEGQAGIEINRKMLSEMAINDAVAFTALCDLAKNA